MTSPPLPPIRVVLVDDEPPARRTLSLLLGRDPSMAIVAECENGRAAIEAIEQHRPDAVFLDVQMPGIDGFGVLDVVGADAVPAVVFVTAYDKYALAAFEAHALDYLLKPFTDERFADVLGRVKARLRDRSFNDLEARISALIGARERPRQLVIRDGGRVIVIPWSEIDWIEAEDYCVRIHAGREKPLVRRTLRSLLDVLDPAQFARIHRSSLVNLQRIRQVKPLPSGDYEVHLVDGTKLRMSRGYRDVVLAGLQE